ncbi:protein kinase-like domain, Concanavalin A-like lectin/glucanase domain protein [Artemisia annua]|uniref:Protein kinase-like domain, Concanavalin A-like lectin/glucanase domain protein n=1 Tax=Artemisia annua TaxID=35608 RepID=A0A2U1NKJ8_ARTAN|nr:protein kinase-like domain, Concanavalin A-like lectin/glucanase domain protein [Artemisia annua]
MASVVLMLNSFSLTLPLPSGPAFFMHSGTDPEMPLFSDYTSSTSSSGPGKYKLSKSKSRSSHVSVNDLSISELHPAVHPNPFYNLLIWNWDHVIVISNDDDEDMITTTVENQFVVDGWKRFIV